MPYFHYFATFSLFYVFPFIYVGVNIWAVVTTDINKSWLGPYLGLFTIVAFPLIFWYDNTIYHICESLKESHAVNLQYDEDDQVNLAAYREKQAEKEASKKGTEPAEEGEKPLASQDDEEAEGKEEGEEGEGEAEGAAEYGEEDADDDDRDELEKIIEDVY